MLRACVITRRLCLVFAVYLTKILEEFFKHEILFNKFSTMKIRSYRRRKVFVTTFFQFLFIQGITNTKYLLVTFNVTLSFCLPEFFNCSRVLSIVITFK